MDRWRWVGLGGWIVVTYAAAGIGGRFQPGPWYDALEKPPWTPPDWVFAPVWLALYGMMAVAAWLVWRARGFGGAPGALALFGVQLALNVAWSWLFFGLRSPGLALADLVALWVAIVATAVAFRRVRPVAGGLLLPYLAWVTFAGALNLEIWRLNP